MDFDQFFTHTRGQVFSEVDFSDLDEQGYSIVETQRESCYDCEYTGTVVHRIFGKDKTLSIATFQALWCDGDLEDITVTTEEGGYGLLISRAAHLVSLHFQKKFYNA